jgi:hypothetical protein|tara:strand:- start:94 stop:315 length:222 start_codon:yes stop_codon:yes gene_type:complete
VEALIGNVIKRLKVDCLVDMANYQTKGDGPEVLDLLIERIAFEIEKQFGQNTANKFLENSLIVDGRKKISTKG